MLKHMNSEFKFLCNTHQACPEVKQVLVELGFTNLRDLDNSPSFDISAKYDLKDTKHAEKVARQVFEKCQRRVQTIQIHVKH